MNEEAEKDIQHQTDLEQAKAKLDEIQKKQNGDRREPDIPKPKPRPKNADDKGIRPVDKKPKKKKFGQKLKEAMFSEDIGNGSVTEYVFFKILVPSVKRVLSDMANTAINMALGLDPKTRTVGNNPHTSNASLYRDRNLNRPGDGRSSYGRRNAVSEYEWDEETARDIYTQIEDLIDRFGQCSLSDAYSIMGMGSQIRTTDRYWGWTSMKGADVLSVDRLGERWIVDMPSAEALPR